MHEWRECGMCRSPLVIRGEKSRVEDLRREGVALRRSRNRPERTGKIVKGTLGKI
jgi:hypothetical protein